MASQTAEALMAEVQKDPDAWMLYLRNNHQYLQNLESSFGVARAADQKQITELEIEKRHLVAAASPAVQTPRETAFLPPRATAEAHGDDPTRPPTFITPPRSGTASLSEKIPDPKEFDGTQDDLWRIVQQIYGKMNANANADRFPLATNRMTYVAGRLTGRAYQLMLPKIRYGIPQFVDYPQEH
ncbi:Retrotransposable element [Pyrenophora seminiperda CCB06]|uniref:Retrotransposable element n=1 Tax=Pyrenophora seminiperda CCB06 TaxID=1302712 RepID=A0A3M7MH21_9PLEO|nr:Retrotransposable element [Pyrenophora seminiperda CCB06]